MTLQNRFSGERLRWQYNTQQDIKRKLLFVDADIPMERQRDHRLVVVFGKPQVGKTTLILSLMGIAEDRHEEISKILRAGIPEGNSSTSTAIIYQHSENEFFGICERDTNGNQTMDLYQCETEEFVERLQEVRRRLENGEKNPDFILYLYLPRRYFDLGTGDNSDISILDVPGYGSRNKQESRYVEELISRYMTASALNIVVRELYDINDLRYFQAPNGDRMEWMPHRYLVVTTHSYSQESITSYFTQKKRTESFEEYLKHECDVQFQRIFGEQSPRHIAVDVGQSFQRLINETIKTEEDRQELLSCQRRALEEIRAEIRKRKGDSLSAWIMELRGKIYNNEQHELARICGQIKQTNENIQYSKRQKEKYTKWWNKTDENRRSIEQKKKEIKKYRAKCAVSLNELSKNVIPKMREQLNEKQVWIKGKGVIAHIFDTRQDEDCKIVREVFDGVLTTWIEDELSGRIEQESKTELEDLQDELYAELKSKTRRGGLILGRKAVEEERIQLTEDAILKYTERYQEFLKNKLDSKCGEILSKLEREISQENTRLDWLNYEIQWEKRKQQGCGRYLKNLKQEKKNLEERIERDKALLEEYQSIARQHFQAEKQRMIDAINQASDAQQAVCDMLLLGLICKDYEKMKVS